MRSERPGLALPVPPAPAALVPGSRPREGEEPAVPEPICWDDDEEEEEARSEDEDGEIRVGEERGSTWVFPALGRRDELPAKIDESDVEEDVAGFVREYTLKEDGDPPKEPVTIERRDAHERDVEEISFSQSTHLARRGMDRSPLQGPPSRSSPAGARSS